MYQKRKIDQSTIAITHKQRQREGSKKEGKTGEGE